MNYQKYTWVCTGDCDALIEYTIKDGFGWPAGEMNLKCRCNSDCILLSVADATIPYTDSPLPTEEDKMETTTDTHYMTREFLESQLVQNKAYIAQLESAQTNRLSRFTEMQNELTLMRDNMQEFTLEGLDDDSLTEFQAEEIASICGFELNKEFQVLVTVQYVATVLARNEDDAKDAINDIDFDCANYGEPVINMYSSVDTIEVE